MTSMGTIAVQTGKDGTKKWQAEQIYGGLFSPGPDAVELRAWVADDTELGKRVADDFVSTGRCPAGTLDRHLFAVQLRKSRIPAIRRSAGRVWGRPACASSIHTTCHSVARVTAPSTLGCRLACL